MIALRKLVIAASAAVAISAPAAAADATAADTGAGHGLFASGVNLNWAGPYLGPEVTFWFDQSGGGTYHSVGIGGGYNFVNNRTVFGLDGHVGTYYDGDGLTGLLQARLGYLVTSRLLLYGAAGAGFCCVDTGTAAYAAVGAGTEFALTDHVTMANKVNLLFPDWGTQIETMSTIRWHFN